MAEIGRERYEKGRSTAGIVGPVVPPSGHGTGTHIIAAICEASVAMFDPDRFPHGPYMPLHHKVHIGHSVKLEAKLI